MLPEVLVGLEHGQHLLVFGDLGGVGHHAGLAICCAHGALEVDRNERVLHQLELSVAELEVGTAYVFAPFVGLYDPGTILAIRLALGARHIGPVQHILGLHAGRVLGVTTDHQVDALDRPGHLYVALRLGAVVAVFVVAHVGRGNHHIDLGAQLRNHFRSFGDDAAKLNILDVVRTHHLVGVFGGEAHHTDPHTAQVENLVRLKHALAVLINIGRQHRELDQVALHLQHYQRLVEFVVSDSHGIVSKQVHAFEIRHGVLQVRLGYAGVYVATIEQQTVAAGTRYLGAELVDQRFACRHTVLAISVFPESAVVVVGVQNRYLESLVALGA